MNEKNMSHIKDALTMPPEITDALLQNCAPPTVRHYRYSRYSRICAALAAIFCICAAGSTSFAAYNIYQEKQLAVFMDYDLTQEEIAAVGDALAQVPDITIRYISGDEAWEQFKTKYLSDDAQLEELAASMGNPLSHSFNYEVSVRLGADTEAVRDTISRIDGVRLITTRRALKKANESIIE